MLTERKVAVALTTCGFGLGLFAAPVHAAVVGSVPYSPRQAPVPAGAQGVAWLDDARQEESWTLWTARYGAQPKRVQRFVAGRPPVIGSLYPGGFAASASHVALRVISFGPGPPHERPLYEDVRTFAAGFGKPLQQVAGCRFVDSDAPIGFTALPFQLQGSSLLFGRGERCGEFVERDLSIGRSSDRSVAHAGVVRVRVAGRYVARLERDLSDPRASTSTAVVQDRLTGQEVTRVPLDAGYDVSLRDDGTLALSVGDAVAIAEPGATEVRRLPIRVSRSNGPLPWIGQHLAVTSANQPRELQLIDTDGHVVRRLVEILPEIATPTAAAINDTHVTWLSRACQHVLINARPITAQGVVRYRPDRYSCRLRQAGPTVLTNRSVRLGVSCRSLDLYCSASITVHRGPHLIARGKAFRTYRDGTAARGTLHIRPSARKHLPTRGQVQLRITARYADSDSVRSITVRLPIQ